MTESATHRDQTAIAPAHWTADVVMSNGRTCKIRPTQPADLEALYEFFASLSDDSIHMRYFEENRDLAKRDADRLAVADHNKVVALVAVAKGQIVGIGNYDRLDHAEAEIAFAVRDSYQGVGLGSLLLEHLAAVARENGVRRFRAEVLAANRKMLGTFESSGYKPSSKVDSTVMVMDFDIKPTPEIREIAALREHRADALSVRYVFQPRSIAVWSNSLSDGTLGRLVLDNIVEGGFPDPVYAIHEAATDIGSVSGYASLSDVGRAVDLVVLAGTSDEIESRIAPCSAASVETALVLTGGFRPSIESNRHEVLIDAFREAGIRVVGPSALGIINTDPRHTLNATAISPIPKRGRIGLYCNTGALGQALLKLADRRGLGISTFVATGYRVDIAANDVLQYWEDDPSTAVVLIYLEEINNPRKFLRLARRVAGKKPIVATLVGRKTQSSPLGKAAATTNLPSWAIAEMMQQEGIMLVDSASEMLDIASILTLQPAPLGRGLAVVSDSVVLGELVLEAARSTGLDPVADRFRLTATDDIAVIEDALRLALSDPAVHSLVVCHVPPVFGESDAVAQALLRVSREATKPIVAVMLAGHAEPLVAERDSNGLPSHGSIPVFTNVEDAVSALKAVVDYKTWLKKPHGKQVEFRELERSRAESVLEKELLECTNSFEVRELAAASLSELLASYEIELWPAIPIYSEDEATAAAKQVGYPVVLKVVDRRLDHQVDSSGVRLSIENELTLRTAYLSMLATLPDFESWQLVVQHMAPPGVAVVVDSQEDQLFGPVISFRLAGEVSNLIGDCSHYPAPLTDRDAVELISSPAASQILTNPKYHPQQLAGHYAGDSIASLPDLTALTDLVLRVGLLNDDFPELASLRLSPVIVHAHGVAVLGATGTVARAQVRTDLEARRLR